VERVDAVEGWRRSKQYTDGAGEGAAGDVSTKQSMVYSKAFAVERLRGIGVEEALDGIDRDTEADAHSLLCFGDDAAAASAELDNGFAGLQSGQLKSSFCIRTMAGINIGRAAHHVCKVVIGVGKRTRVYHGDDIEERALREIS
jgi:hypothetical protein